MAMLDRQLRYLAVNRRWQTDWLRPTPLLGRPHYDVYPTSPSTGATPTGAASPANRPGRTGAPPFPDAGPTWLRWEAQPWYDSPGVPGGIALFVDNITARVEAEEAARVAREDQAELIATIDGIVWRRTPGRSGARSSARRPSECSVFRSARGWTTGLLGGAHPSGRPRRLDALLRRMHARRPRPPVRLPDDRRRRAGGLAAGSGHRARRRRHRRPCAG